MKNKVKVVVTEHSKLICIKRENFESLNYAPTDIPSVNDLIKKELKYS